MYYKIVIHELYDLSKTIAAQYFKQVDYPWELLPKIKDIIPEIGAGLSLEEYYKPAENIWIHKSAKVAATASIEGPVIICAEAELRHCAFIRGNAIIGEGAVVGNSTELKNVILFDKVQVPHYNYVGDSILGYKAHMGAGSITSNVRADKANICISYENKKIETGLRKFGAMIGDNVEVGCGAVLNPGVVIGRNTNIYPLSMVRGYIPAKSIYKKAGEIAEKKPLF